MDQQHHAVAIFAVTFQLVPLIDRVRIGLGANGGELGKIRGKVRGEEREEGARCKSSDGEVPRLPPSQFAP